jgi:hypothetical protein
MGHEIRGGEITYLIPHSKPVNRLQVLQLAITNDCPLRREHYFEWNNLNKPEVFSEEEMKVIVNKFQEFGVCTISSYRCADENRGT